MNWTPVTEKMPLEYRALILSINLFGKECVIFGYYTGREFYDDDNFLIGDNEAVTAWMFKPQPYKSN